MNLGAVNALAVTELPVGALVLHEDNARVFGAGSEEKNQRLAESVLEHGVVRPLIAEKRPDGKFIVLSGSRRLAAALAANRKTVPVRVVGRLDDDSQWQILVAENGIQSTERDQDDEQGLWRAEAYARSKLARGRGARVDLRGEEAGETDDIIAALTGQTRTAIRDRHKIFGSACSSLKLQAAVQEKRVARTVGAGLIRRVEAEVASRELKPESAAARVDELMATGGGGRKRRASRGEGAREAPAAGEGGRGPRTSEPVTTVSTGDLRRIEGPLRDAALRAADLADRWLAATGAFRALASVPVRDVDRAALLADAAQHIAAAAVALARIEAELVDGSWPAEPGDA